MSYTNINLKEGTLLCKLIETLRRKKYYILRWLKYHSNFSKSIRF